MLTCTKQHRAAPTREHQPTSFPRAPRYPDGGESPSNYGNFSKIPWLHHHNEHDLGFRDIPDDEDCDDDPYYEGHVEFDDTERFTAQRNSQGEYLREYLTSRFITSDPSNFVTLHPWRLKHDQDNILSIRQTSWTLYLRVHAAKEPNWGPSPMGWVKRVYPTDGRQ